MPKYVCTAKVGINGVVAAIRDVETGEVFQIMIGPREAGERFIKKISELIDMEIKWE